MDQFLGGVDGEASDCASTVLDPLAHRRERGVRDEAPPDCEGLVGAGRGFDFAERPPFPHGLQFEPGTGMRHAEAPRILRRRA